MKPVLNLYKEIGETPLQRIERFKEETPEYKDKKLTYAGRLDPMAEGVLLVLAGEECKSKHQYLGLPKTYKFEAVFGLETDSYDILGKILNIAPPPEKMFGEIRDFLADFEGEIEQKYPPFSSKPVFGKPLFEWAKEGRLSEISLPVKTNEIYNIELETERSIALSEICYKLRGITARLRGEFRQDEILKNWRELGERCNIDFPVISLYIECSSGTYVRDIVYQLGRKVGCGQLH